MKNTIELKHVSKEYPGFHLKDVSFCIPAGTIVGLVGENGAGKTTTIQAILNCPKLLVLDEPTSGLDPIVRNEILDIFRDYILEDESRSILLSSHITTDLESIADYIVFLHEGEIVFQLPTSDLLEKYGILKCSEKEFEQIQKEDVIRYQKRKYQYEVLISDKQKMRKKYPFAVIDKATIDEIMLFYVKGEK